MHRYKLTLSYDGTAFVGWQRQAEGVSIQGLVEEALGPLEGAPVAVAGAGRTDAGVHAIGQVASASLSRSIDPGTLTRAMNFRLPSTVRVLEAESVADGFHARFDARSKTYRYRIWNAHVLNPFERDYVWHIPEPSLDVDAMAEAARVLEGEHDFAAFQGAGQIARSTVRTVFQAGLSHRDHLITFDIRGDGFLRHMVRAITGSLVEVGRGRHPPAWLEEVLDSRTRARAGRTAPAAGLFLVRVDY